MKDNFFRLSGRRPTSFLRKFVYFLCCGVVFTLSLCTLTSFSRSSSRRFIFIILSRCLISLSLFLFFIIELFYGIIKQVELIDPSYSREYSWFNKLLRVRWRRLLRETFCCCCNQLAKAPLAVSAHSQSELQLEMMYQQFNDSIENEGYNEDVQEEKDYNLFFNMNRGGGGGAAMLVAAEEEILHLRLIISFLRPASLAAICISFFLLISSAAYFVTIKGVCPDPVRTVTDSSSFATSFHTVLIAFGLIVMALIIFMVRQGIRSNNNNNNDNNNNNNNYNNNIMSANNLDDHPASPFSAL